MSSKLTRGVCPQPNGSSDGVFIVCKGEACEMQAID